MEPRGGILQGRFDFVTNNKAWLGYEPAALAKGRSIFATTIYSNSSSASPTVPLGQELKITRRLSGEKTAWACVL